MDLIQQEFHRLSSDDQEMLMENSVMRDMFSETWAQEFNLPVAEVLSTITAIMAKVSGNLEEVFSSKIVVAKKPVQKTYYELMDWHDKEIVEPLALAFWRKSLVESGLTYSQSQLQNPVSTDLDIYRRQVMHMIKNSPMSAPKPPELIYGLSTKAQERRARLLRSFTRVLGQVPDGMSKTQLLHKLSKDNGSWRGIADEVLDYMLQTGKAVKVGTIYYSTNHAPLERENSYHRLVYEYLSANGACSVTTLLNHMGYNNSKGRKKIRQILHQLYEEGYVVPQGRKWKVS
jgi:hypothetical protein